MYLRRYVWARICVALYFSCSVLLASLTILETQHVRLPGHFLSPLLVAIALTPLQFVLYAALLNIRREAIFRKLFPIASGFALAGTIAAGIFSNPEYLRSAFHGVASLYIIFLYRRDPKGKDRGGSFNNKFLYRFSLIVAAAGFIWVIIYGFYGVVLHALGTESWMIFNGYTVGVIVIGLNAILQLKRASYTEVRVSASSFHVDGHDFTGLFGQKDLLLLNIFVSREDRHATCAQIMDELSLPELRAGHLGSTDCQTCVRDRQKATRCSSYRRVYNQVLKVKKILESMDVGTVNPPKNKMNVKTDGWVLRIFENVRLERQ